MSEVTETITCACGQDFTEASAYYDHCTTCPEVPEAPEPPPE